MNGFMKGGKDFVSPMGWADIYYKANQEFIASGVLVMIGDFPEMLLRKIASYSCTTGTRTSVRIL